MSKLWGNVLLLVSSLFAVWMFNGFLLAYELLEPAERKVAVARWMHRMTVGHNAKMSGPNAGTLGRTRPTVFFCWQPNRDRRIPGRGCIVVAFLTRLARTVFQQASSLEIKRGVKLFGLA